MDAKNIPPVPSANDLVDVVLSRTQRRTPTVVHAQFKITRIRGFYMRKVKYAQDSFHEKLSLILDKFPKLEEIHPFYADLCNVLYDRDHYKLALGHLNAVRTTIDTLAKDYVKLLKFSDSLYKCKMLKRAALGRMSTMVKKLSQPLSYLEEVRQHIGRLPTINPTGRGLILAGYPNVGKSSFLNSVSRANVDVQPFPFTTKSLYVGHFDYDLMRWQVIDTPGVLDRPLQDRNTIELTAITAIAHLQATVIFFIDLSESCGFSVADQVKLFHSLSPLFAQKPVVIVFSKVDLRHPKEVDAEEQKTIESLVASHPGCIFAACSTKTSEGIENVKEQSCSALLKQRLDNKFEHQTGEQILSGLTITKTVVPQNRPAVLPNVLPKIFRETMEDSNTTKSKAAKQKRGLSAEIKKLLDEKIKEDENGGPGNYQFDQRAQYLLEDDSWKYDIPPEIFDGKNVADFVDPDIKRKLLLLEQEEEEALRQTMLDPFDDSEFTNIGIALKNIDDAVRMRKVMRGVSVGSKRKLPRSKRVAPEKSIETMQRLGYSTEGFEKVVKPKPIVDLVREPMDLPEDATPSQKLHHRLQIMQAKRTPTEVGRRLRGQLSLKGVGPEKTKTVLKLDRQVKKRWNTSDHKMESDRKIVDVKPRHLFAGKMSNGKRNHR